MKRTGILLRAVALAAMIASPAWAADLEHRIDAELPELLELYKHLHANPELSYREVETSKLVADELRRLGYTVTEGVGDFGVDGRIGYGVVGVLENGDGPTILVRTDLDALPVPEKTGLPYASRAMGESEDGSPVAVMHACGHDLHMTSFLGTARMLSQLRGSWSGTVVLIGQPAEERGAGANAMIADGLFERFPKPDVALAWHTQAGMAAGSVGLVSGYALANVDSVDITVRGMGGHGAWPHTTKDPVTLAAQIIVNLQTIVSRQISPFDPAVVTVGSIHGGAKHNVIPDEVRLQLTVRSYEPEVRQRLLDSIRSIAVGTARAAGWPEELLPLVTLHEEEFTPSTYNDPLLIERARSVFLDLLGEDRVLAVEPVMGGEDFSYLALEEDIALAVLWLGAVEPARIEAATAGELQLPPLHSSEFTVFPEPAIRTGAMAMTALVLDLLADPLPRP